MSPLQHLGRSQFRLIAFWQLCHVILVGHIDASELHYQIEEEVPVGTMVGNVVVDAEVGHGLPAEVRRSLRFKFLTSPHINVTVDELTGNLMTSGRIDRETLCRELDQQCIIRQSVAVHPIQFFKIVKVAFTVIDINDNSPEFQPNRLVHEVIESTPVDSSFVVPTARDADTAPNSIERYELIDPEGILQLNVTRKLDGSLEVRLVLVRPLDRETREEHRVTVLAHDAGRPSRSGSVNVTVVVLDSNDNVPVFEYGSYEITIAENLPLGTTIVKVTAYDKDVGLNAQVLYFLSSSTQASFGRVFAVNNVTGEIYVVGTVDYERTPVYHLIVSAVDRGQDPVPSETTVIVRVEDVNDNAPRITVNTLVASGTNVSDVLEDAPVATFVGHVIVTDPDKGPNGQFNCSSSNGQNFRLQHFFNGEYHVMTATSLDYERKRRYVIVVSCSDNGTPPLASTADVTVNVIDVNDNTPRCSPEVYESEILENNYNGVVVLQVNCTDADSPPNSVKSYEISDEGRANFAVSRDTGIVSATSSLNREASESHRFLVLAIDGGSPPRTGTATVVITVTDVNDERPIFSRDSFAFEVEENQPQGSLVGSLVASDSDAPPFNSFLFILVPSGSLSDAFTVNRMSGKISTTRMLDREEQEVYHMKAIVTDSHGPSMTSSADVTVIVLDTNDHSPRFLFPTLGNNTVHVAGDALDGQTLGRIVAKDEDDRLNGEVTYSIVKGNDQEVFRIDQVTGYLKANVDIETVSNKTFSLVICAMDRAAEPSKSFAYLNVLVVPRGSRTDGFQAFVSFDRNNLVPILVVCGVSAVVISVLLVAIFVVVCQQRTRNKDADRKYNCRTETLKAMSAPGVDGLATEVGHRIGGSDDAADSQGMDSTIEVRVVQGKPVSRCVGSLGMESLKPPDYYEVRSSITDRILCITSYTLMLNNMV